MEAAEHDIHEGATVTGSNGEKLGTVDEVRHDPASGRPSTFAVKSGFWIFSKRKELSVDFIQQVDAESNTIAVELSRDEFRGVPELES